LEAGASPSEVRKYVLGEVLEIKDRYEPIENFTRCLFSSGTGPQIIEGIKRVLLSLMDAIVVVGELTGRIQSKLSEEAALIPFSNLPPSTRIRMLRAAMPIEGLYPDIDYAREKPPSGPEQGTAPSPSQPQGKDPSEEKEPKVD